MNANDFVNRYNKSEKEYVPSKESIEAFARYALPLIRKMYLEEQEKSKQKQSK